MDTLFIGKNQLFLHEVESTNTYAMNLLRNVNVLDGTLIYTNHQTNGKGQRGALWCSEMAQNITASVILRAPFLTVEKSFFLSQISALAIYDVLTEILPQSQYDIKIKWPNDILVNKQKIAGILIENIFQQQHIHYSVIGVGLNVHQTHFPNIETNATSLKKLTHQHFDKKELMEKCCQQLEKWYFKLKEKQLTIIHQAYLHQLLGFNELMRFKDATGDEFYGTITGVTDAGKLTIATEPSLIRSFDLKEVVFLL